MKKLFAKRDHDFLSTIFCLTGPKNFLRETFCVSENFWYRKIFMDRRRVGYHVFPAKVFLSHSTGKLPRGTLVFQKCYAVEFFRIIGVPRFCRFFWLTLPKFFVKEPFCVSECVGYRKILCLRGQYYDFVPESCCLTVPKKFVGEPFCVSENFWYRKVLCIGGGNQGLENFLSHRTEKIRKWTLLYFRKWYPKKIMEKRGEGVTHFSVEKFLSECQTISYGNLLESHSFRVSKNFMLKKVMSRFSVDNFLSHRTEKLRRRTLLCFGNFLV